MARALSKGNCYICGKELTKTGAKRHILTHDYHGENSQKCRLIKIEDPYNKAYWLYVDIPLTSDLETLDSFLREIWLECCGHMSAFFVGCYDEIDMDMSISLIRDGSVLKYEYDFGSTTELTVSFVGTTIRESQEEDVRLLIRNKAPEYSCCQCGKPAAFICSECIYETDNPFFCEACGKKHFDGEHKFGLPVVNSPRMGVCGYCGELDVYEFDPAEIKKE